MNNPPCVSRSYKTELCTTFVDNGKCKYGKRCLFAHGEAELRDGAIDSTSQHTSSKRRLRVGCDAFCEIDWREGAVADAEARLAYRIEQKCLQAVQRRAERGRAAPAHR